MTVRVRYRSNDLSEGVVEDVPEANAYRVLPDNTLELRCVWVDPESDEPNKRHVTTVGVVHQDRWESAVVREEADAE